MAVIYVRHGCIWNHPWSRMNFLAKALPEINYSLTCIYWLTISWSPVQLHNSSEGNYFVNRVMVLLSWNPYSALGHQGGILEHFHCLPLDVFAWQFWSSRRNRNVCNINFMCRKFSPESHEWFGCQSENVAIKKSLRVCFLFVSLV